MMSHQLIIFKENLKIGELDGRTYYWLVPVSDARGEHGDGVKPLYTRIQMLDLENAIPEFLGEVEITQEDRERAEDRFTT